VSEQFRLFCIVGCWLSYWILGPLTDWLLFGSLSVRSEVLGFLALLIGQNVGNAWLRRKEVLTR
jgi:hypothetical protein